MSPSHGVDSRSPALARSRRGVAALLLLCAFTLARAADPPADTHADLILHHGRVVAVDANFSVHEAIAIRAGRVLAVGSDRAILRLGGAATTLVDLDGRMVLPGLVDSHAHAADAALTEFDHELPAMEAIEDVLAYIRQRAAVLPQGQWIVVRQVFITRLREQRYPTRDELDRAAPLHPVMFATGPDASLNSLALRLSGIDRNFTVRDGGSGFAEKDAVSGEPTGILRNCSRYVKAAPSTRRPSLDARVGRLRALFADYNTVGVTMICDRDVRPDSLEAYRELRRRDDPPTVRVRLSRHIESIGPLEPLLAAIGQVSEDPLFLGRDPYLRVVGVKTYLDGGMLTGSAYLREPWGVSRIYGITDPEYRGVRFIPQERLVAMARVAIERGLQFTAHSVGDGAVHALLEAYAEIDRTTPLQPARACISHSNFMSREAIAAAARLGVVIDLQPVWLHLDAHTLERQFGSDRLRYFQPLRSLFAAGVTIGGGSDHMQKIGADRAVNPYNPFLGIATAVTRQPRFLSRPLHPGEALSREQAIRFYTLNNARILRCDDELGSLEPGKQADLIVVDTDLLRCPPERLAHTRVLRTYVGGRLVFKRETDR